MTLAARAAAAAAAAAFLALPALATSFAPFPDAPPPAHTGGFGEPTCHACHFTYDLQPPENALAIDGLPDRFAPGQTYRLTVRLTRPDLATAGFQLAARFAEGPDSARQAGHLRTLDDRTHITSHGTPALQYLHQTRIGATPSRPDSAAWSFLWTAPPGTAAVLIHVSANAGNDDASPGGDHVYARAWPLHALDAGSADRGD